MILVFHIQHTPVPQLDKFLNAPEIYLVQRNKSRLTYTYSTTQGTLEFSVGADERITGLPVAELLKIAYGYALSRLNPADGTVDTTPFGIESLTGELRALQLPEPRVSRGFPPCTLGDREDLPVAYRTFMSGRELNAILAFPAQQEYAAFRLLAVVNATSSLLPESGLHRITAPVRRRYRVVYPEGVSPSATFVDHGDSLTLIYTAPRHYSYSRTIVAGEPNPFTNVEGSILTVEPLENTDIVLRPIAPSSSSAKDNSSDDATATQPADSGAIAPGPGAENARIVTLKLHFDDDHILDVPLEMRSDAAEYRLLRDGTYHGYRARRLQVRVPGEEAYLIDVRTSASAPKPEQTEQPAETVQAPVFINATTDSDTTPEEPQSRSRLWLTIGAVIVAIALAIWAVARFMPGVASLSSAYAPGEVELFEPAEATTDTIGTTVSAVPAAPAPEATPATAEVATPAQEPANDTAGTLTADETADIAYLNANSKWDQSRIKSARFSNLPAILASGDLGAIARHPYFAAGHCTNREARSVAEFAWKAQESGTHRANEQRLKKLNNVSVIDIHQLYEDLARIRPSDPYSTPSPLPAAPAGAPKK